MKEIRMDYSEYEDMQNRIKSLQDVIQQIENRGDGIIVIDYRGMSSGLRFDTSDFVPKIHGDANKVKDFLQADFNNLHAALLEKERRLNDAKHTISVLKNELNDLKEAKRKKNWFFS